MILKRHIEDLRTHLRDIEPYPSTCAGFKRWMPCRAFFPGGNGLWKEDYLDQRPIKTIFLGSDFNSEEIYDLEFKKPAALIEDSPATWRGLVRLMNLAKINPEECFFTNAWPCLRVGNAKNTGDPPGAKDIAFTDRCLDFFRLTLREFVPEDVVTLGTWPTQFVSGLDPIKMKSWKRPKWSEIDREDHITLTTNGKDTTFIPAIHPCLPNHRYRPVHSTPEAEAAHIRGIMKT